MEVLFMYEDKVVSNGYIKLLALSVGHLETEIIMEQNTNSQQDIDSFKEKYDGIKRISSQTPETYVITAKSR